MADLPEIKRVFALVGIGRNQDAYPFATTNNAPDFQARIVATNTVYKNAVAAIQIADRHNRTINAKLGMPTRDLGSGQDHIARFISPHHAP